MADLISERRKETSGRIDLIKRELAEAERLCVGKACVYATGSFARGEAHKFSDLDVFIVGGGTPEKPLLSRLDEILVKADLIDTTKKLGIPEFSGDGEYLTHYTAAELIKSLGKPEDDVSNTFTARLLLLLESTPLLGDAVYTELTQDVITAYWRDYEDHKNDFMPAFLANDVLRMWRTFCVNYEARTTTAPPAKKAKRKLKNYKLKHSRLLTCYSALLYLLTVFSKKHTVSPIDTVQMISLTPTQRLEWMLSQQDLRVAHPKLGDILHLYEEFLTATEAPENDLVEAFMDKAQSRKYIESANKFGNLVFEVLEIIGQNNPFYRLLVV